MKIINAKAEIIRPDLDNPESIDAIYRTIEDAGRTCYKSKNKKVAELEKAIEEIKENQNFTITLVSLERQLEKAKKESARAFVRSLVKSGHEAMLEHAFMAVRFTVDRGISHELARHRIASLAQESTRYCAYNKDKFGGDVTVIEPVFYKDISDERKLAIQNMFTEEYKQPADLVNTLSNVEKRYADWFYSCYVGCESYLEMINCGATPEEARNVLPTSTKTEVVVTANIREWRHMFKLRAVGTTGKPHPQMVEVMMPLFEKCKKLMPELFDDIKVEGE